MNADINASAAIADSKLAQITTASKVSGAALTSINSIPDAGGQLRVKNGGLGSDFSTTAQGNIFYFDGTGSIQVLAPGTSGRALKTQGAGANPQWAAVLGEASCHTVTQGNNTDNYCNTGCYVRGQHRDSDGSAGSLYCCCP